MVTPVTRFNIEPFWGDAYKHLDYVKQPFNNPDNTSHWLDLGFADNFVGSMCDMRGVQPVWNTAIIAKFEALGWKDVCTSYYRMDPGTILPRHQDTYKRYIEIFELENFENQLNDFKSKFSKNFTLASKKFGEAITEIDKSISHLQKKIGRAHV